MKRTYVLVGLGAVAAVAAYVFLQPPSVEAPVQAAASAGGAMVAVELPAIEGNAAIGQRIFEASCAGCHGANAAGNDGAGPPLVHVIYEPGHHADEAIQRAVAGGVRSHHWRFGDMPSVDGLTRADVAMVVAYIRDLQRANGIN